MTQTIISEEISISRDHFPRRKSSVAEVFGFLRRGSKAPTEAL